MAADPKTSGKEEELMVSPSALEKEQIFRLAEKEMEYRVDLFNRLTNSCFSKCVQHNYKESELNTGETSCIDRCVSKYWQSLVGCSFLANKFAFSERGWVFAAQKINFVKTITPENLSLS